MIFQTTRQFLIEFYYGGISFSRRRELKAVLLLDPALLSVAVVVIVWIVADTCRRTASAAHVFSLMLTNGPVWQQAQGHRDDVPEFAWPVCGQSAWDFSLDGNPRAQAPSSDSGSTSLERDPCQQGRKVLCPASHFSQGILIPSLSTGLHALFINISNLQGIDLCELSKSYIALQANSAPVGSS